jgi:hypothetical protein
LEIMTEALEHNGRKRENRRLHRRAVIGIAAVLLGLLLVLGVFGLRYYLHRTAETALQREIGRLPGIRSVAYEDLTVNLSAPRLILHQVLLELENGGEPIAVEKVTVYDYDARGRLPSRFDVRFSGMRISVAGMELGMVGAFLRELGYREIRADAALRGRYRMEGRVLEVEKLRVAAPEMGRLTATLRLDGFNPADLAPARRNVLLLLGLLSRVGLGETEIDYRDTGLLARATAPTGTAGQQPDGGLLRDIADHLTVESARQPAGNVGVVLDNLAGFLRDPHRIHMRADPPQSVPLARLAWSADIRQLTEMLRLRVTNHPS